MNLGPFDINSIYCGDCVSLMESLPNECIDLTVTSPPYDNLRDYKGYTFDFEAIARQLWRVTKPGGVVVWVVVDETKDGSESGTSFRQALGFMAVGFRLHDTMIYGKENYIPLSHNRYEPQFEFMFVFSKGNPDVFNPMITRSIFGGRAIKRSRKTYDSHSFRPRDIGQTQDTKVRGNIWMYTIGGHGSESHVAQFPEALARDHILSWSNPGDIVLDPMVGSGTTCKMAHLSGRNYLGFDISEEYCQLARQRVANVEVQPFLIPPTAEDKPEQLNLI